MGSASSIFANKSIYLTYDESSQDVKIWEFTNSIKNLPIKLFINDSSKINDSNIMIHLVSKSSIKHHKQLSDINSGIHKVSIFIYTDRKVPIIKNNNLTENNQSISLSYLDYNNFEEIFPIILTKLQEY
jgi:hypothetical protein|uniref:Uncharacterized protein n=1 Tax=viral metagenome TaxID=1070528 RepID=A0A6C0CKS3_9ZZZZ